MASELCDAQEVIHELLGTGASQNETEYNYRVTLLAGVVIQILRLLLLLWWVEVVVVVVVLCVSELS